MGPSHAYLTHSLFVHRWDRQVKHPGAHYFISLPHLLSDIQMNKPLSSFFVKQSAQWPSLKPNWCRTGLESAAIPTSQLVCQYVLSLPMGKRKLEMKKADCRPVFAKIPSPSAVSQHFFPTDVTDEVLQKIAHYATSSQPCRCKSIKPHARSGPNLGKVRFRVHCHPLPLSHHQSLSLLRLQLARSPPRASRPTQLRVVPLIDSRCIMMDVLHSSKRDGCLRGNLASGLMQQKPPNSQKNTPQKC